MSISSRTKTGWAATSIPLDRFLAQVDGKHRASGLDLENAPAGDNCVRLARTLTME